MRKFAFLLALVLIFGLAFSRGGGGCFLPGTLVQTPNGEKQIEQILIGEEVLSFSDKGLENAKVIEKDIVERDYYYILRTANGEVKVTAEHPFYTNNGYVTTAELNVGDLLYMFKNGMFEAEKLLGIKLVNEQITAYNLQVSEPHTFFANDYAVHNKGCFLAGTKVTINQGEKNIEDVKIGDIVYSFDEKGELTNSLVVNTYSVIREYYYVIKTKTKEVKVTAEHPFYTSNGYVEAAQLKVENELFVFGEDGALTKEKILSIERINETALVYNLQVDDTHTFFASGFAVHNKGCFEGDTEIECLNGSKKISEVQPGESILSFYNGQTIPTEVLNVYSLIVNEYYILTTDSSSVKVTAEHPFYTTNGFIKAKDLKVEDEIYVLINSTMKKEKITSMELIESPLTVYNLQVSEPHTFFANDYAVHNKGCFLAGTKVTINQGEKNIEDVKIGDIVYSFDEKGEIKSSKVTRTYEVIRDHYYIIKTENNSVSATAEHPFYTEKGYITAEKLAVGNELFVYLEGKITKEKIISITRVDKQVKAYNLEVDNTHTFFANGFAVHNKGCFQEGTKVVSKDGLKNIEDVSIGEVVYSFDERGSITTSRVIDVYSVSSDWYYSIKTETWNANVTEEHPFYTEQGYVLAKDLEVGQEVYVLKNGQMVKESILSKILVTSPITAYNLQVGNTHTFFANGFAVHNKGRRSSSPPDNVFYYDCTRKMESDGKNISCCKQVSSKRITSPTISSAKTSQYPYCSCTSATCRCVNDAKYKDSQTPACPFELGDVWLLLYSTRYCCPGIIIFVIVYLALKHTGKGSRANSEWSSTLSISKSRIFDKSKKVSELLNSLAKIYPEWNEAKMKETATSTFLKLQDCWGKRDYTEMQTLLTSSLYAQHVSQLESMKSRHEINKLEDLTLLEMEIILAKKFEDEKKNEFTVWLRAQAKDTIIDDRTMKKIRGDVGIGQFEEFWTFQWENKSWKLREITQPEEGAQILRQENFHEMETQAGLERKYEKAGGPAIANIAVSSSREQEEGAASVGMDTIKSKGQKVHRLLNFLAESSPIWGEVSMKGTVRSMFIMLNTAIEMRDLSKVKESIAPEFYSTLQANVANMVAQKQKVQKRNLAIRDVEIVLVRNYYDLSKDEFTAWASGQAQQVVVDESTEQIISGDSYVADFEEFWTFVRNKDKWVLKAIDKGFKADDFVNQENVDEGTSDQMLQWYYSRDRTV